MFDIVLPCHSVVDILFARRPDGTGWNIVLIIAVVVERFLAPEPVIVRDVDGGCGVGDRLPIRLTQWCHVAYEHEYGF